MHASCATTDGGDIRALTTAEVRHVSGGTEPPADLGTIVVTGVSAAVMTYVTSGGSYGEYPEDNASIDPDGQEAVDEFDLLRCPDLAFLEHMIEQNRSDSALAVAAMLFGLGDWTPEMRQETFDSVWEGFEQATLEGRFDWGNPQLLFDSVMNNTSATDLLATSLRGITTNAVTQFTVFAAIGELYEGYLDQIRIDQEQAERGCG